MKFDLISDLHRDFWNENEQVNWDGIGTSLVACILGDISSDINIAYKTIVDISKHYKYTIFVDGNHEHDNQCGFQERNQQLKNELSKYQNIVYLNRSAIVIDGTAFVGANGWWTFDYMEPDVTREEAYWYFLTNNIYSEPFMHEVHQTAIDDAKIMSEIVAKLSNDSSVREIVLLTHTSPSKEFMDFKNFSSNHPAYFSKCGNSNLKRILKFDRSKKIKIWCFGHVHQEFDEVVKNIRYICHPRGRKDDCPENLFYYPKMIEI